MTQQQLRDALTAHFQQAQITVESPDEVHFSAVIISEEFTGLSQVKRHQLVYQVLGEVVGREVHALSLLTQTPEEANNQSE